MKKLLLLALMMASGALCAQEKMSIERNIRYADVPEKPYVKDTSSDRRLDLYRPVDAGKSTPVVLFIHGGGFSGGDKYSKTTFIMFRKLVDAGYAVVSINYRLYMRYNKIKGISCGSEMKDGLPANGRFHELIENSIEVASEDAQLALEWLKKNGKKYGLDAKRVAIAGGSAGAMTSLHVAYASDQKILPIKAVINLWGGLADVSVIQKGAPAMLGYHGDKDALINIAYANAIKEQMDRVGVRCDMNTLQGKGHAIYDYIGNNRMKDVVAFLDQVIK